MLPWMQAMRMKDGAPAAYLCVGKSCQRPVGDPEQLKALLA